MEDKRTLIIIPTYQEASNIPRLILELMQLDENIHVLFVDDNSPDGTSELIKESAERWKGRIFILEREAKLGLGTAYVAGFKYAIEKNYDHICEMDADFSHDPADIPKLIEVVHSGEADVAIGSRYHNGISIINWPLSRLILSYSANLYARIITGMPVKDTTAGYKCFRRAVIESIPLDKIKSNGYAFQIEMHYRAWTAGFKLQEVSIIFRERVQGTSKMSKSIIWEAVYMVWGLKIRKILGRL